MNVVDLRSDTVTRPSDAMRRAMAQALVGDDSYGEDPTVNRLEAECARVLGKESALFVPSGTMGNLVSVLAHCQRGDEIRRDVDGWPLITRTPKRFTAPCSNKVASKRTNRRRTSFSSGHVGAGRFRAVTHVDAARGDVLEAAGRLSEVMT